MEGKNEKKKISTKKKIIITLLILLIIGGVAYAAYYFITEHNCNGNELVEYTGDFQIIMYGGYRGNENIVKELNSEEYRIVNTYEEYASLIEKIIITNTHTYTGDVNPKVDMKFKKSFFEDKNLIAITATANNNVILKSYEENNSIATISIKEVWKGTLAVQNYMIFIPANKNIINVELVNSIENAKNNNSSIFDFDTPTDDKPIIYLYPTETTNVTVQLGKPENITCSYPNYIDGWNVEAKPNGDLTDLDTGKYLYSLYYENIHTVDFSLDTGFIVKGEDSASFLEEKLAILGLNERESQEFIIYWLPKLEANNYNYIYFATIDEINQNMPLNITPTPDSLIRVLMVFKGLDNPIDVTPQQLTSPERTGFVAVEWGGSEIK